MLALVRLDSPLLDVAQPIDDLPDPPALQWTAFLAHCDDVEEVLGLVDWTKRMRSLRPRVPVGVAFSKAAADAVAVAARALPLEPLVETATARIDDLPIPQGWLGRRN